MKTVMSDALCVKSENRFFLPITHYALPITAFVASLLCVTAFQQVCSEQKVINICITATATATVTIPISFSGYGNGFCYFAVTLALALTLTFFYYLFR